MRIAGIQILIVILLGMCSLHVSAQQKEPQQMGDNAGQGSIIEKREKQRKAKKDTIPVRIKTWTISRSGLLDKPARIDSTFDDFHVYNPIDKKSISNAQLGNYGQAYESNEFFNRRRKSSFYFYRNYEDYVLFPEDIRYFNTTVPFTFLDYGQSENKNSKSETRFNLLHSQNINPNLNVGFQYRSVNSMGQYLEQSTKDHVLNVFGSYTGKPYQLYTTFILNDADAGENGGMQDDSDVNNFVKDTQDVLFKISTKAKTHLHSAHFFVGQEYRLGYYEDVPDTTVNRSKYKKIKKTKEVFVPRASVVHLLNISTEDRSFHDPNPDTTYYKHIYITPNVTSDTARLVRVDNMFQLKAYEAPDRKFTFGKVAFIEHEFVRMSYPEINPLTGRDYQGFYGKDYSNVFVGGRLYRSMGTFWNWNAEGKLCLTGYKQGDYSLEGNIYKPIAFLGDTVNFKAHGSVESYHPDYFQQQYFSNHRKWNNNFNSTKEVKMNYEVVPNDESFKLGMNYDLLTDYIYNNQDAMPTQAGKPFSIISFYANKKVKLGGLNVDGRVVWQKSSNESYIHLPLMSAMANVYYAFILQKVMHVQFGTECRYYTKFLADAYDVPSASFYLQNDKRIGNYPNIDLYAKLKLKRTQAFFKLENAGNRFIGKDDFGAYNYPMNRMTFRLGISWTFYD